MGYIRSGCVLNYPKLFKKRLRVDSGTRLRKITPLVWDDEQDPLASRIAAIGFVVNWSLRLLLADYGKCDTCPCRNPSAFAAYFAGRLSIITDFA
ncbi:MAG: hypothetical protein M0Z83_02640 [Betaproteobacteria bacterium]|nr:hypothetical protein [Betaproteobacteria bacterium]